MLNSFGKIPEKCWSVSWQPESALGVQVQRQDNRQITIMPLGVQDQRQVDWQKEMRTYPQIKKKENERKENK